MIELFPTAVLDTSIVTAVLVGLLIVWGLQEWLGWGFTGLVVPGYLASIIVIQPLTGAVVVTEALMTWLVMHALSDSVPRWWPWAPLFGRDRFFLALLGSVGVRLAMEGTIFPLLADRYNLRIAAELHSMGLVVVPLLAYAIWRNGPVRAVSRVGIPVALTWIILEYVLLAHTNLSLGSFQLTYEDLALDFVGSPRAYILLLTGAWLGSIANLRYGWDFGGIIVPGLLALCWLQPERLVATLGESLVIALTMRAMLRLPALREVNLAGGRTLVLAVLIGYSMKFSLGHIFGAGWPGLRLRQLFGFGYLLPALMALRIVRSGDPFRTLVPSVATSLAGFLGGTALAYGLAVALPAHNQAQPAPADRDSGGDSLLVAAWANEGTADFDLEALLNSTEPVVVHAGDGFGALWLRPEGRELVISARVGAPPQAQAALSLASLLDARGVLICGAQGPACEEARRRLGLLLPVLSLKVGTDPSTETNLQLSSRVEALLPEDLLPEDLLPEDLLPEGLLRSTLGQASRTRSEGDSKLVLSPVDAWKLAAQGRGQQPETWEHPLAAPMAVGHAAPPGFAGLTRQDLIGSSVAWATGQPWSPDALLLAARATTAMGARMTADDHRASVIADSWRLLVRQSDNPLIITVPRTEDDPNAAALALTLGEALDATLIILDNPPTWDHARPATHRVAHDALLGALQALGPAAHVISVRSIRDVLDADADVVLSLGRPLTDPHDAPTWAQHLASRLDDLGLDVVWYDATATRMSFRDGANATREATALNAGHEAQLTLFATSPVRARAASPDPVGPVFTALDRSSLPIWELSSDQLTSRAIDMERLAAHDPSFIGLDGWTPWLDRVHAFGRSGRPLDLAAAQRLGRHFNATTGIICEPVAGCRWLGALTCSADLCSGLVTSLQPPATDGAEAPVDAEPIDRFLLGDGQLYVDGLPATWVQP